MDFVIGSMNFVPPGPFLNCVAANNGLKFIETGEQAAIAAIPLMRERVLNSADAAEGIRSFSERRSAVFRGI